MSPGNPKLILVPLRLRARRPVNLYGRIALVRRNRWSRVPARSDAKSLIAEGKQKRGFRRAFLCFSGWRPTDLCATVLLSFQGTNTDARPILDRITDRTIGARRQSHGSHGSIAVNRSQLVRPKLLRIVLRRGLWNQCISRRNAGQLPPGMGPSRPSFSL
jgi:hypothetical protein